MESRFVKIGNEYVNVENLENFQNEDSELSLSTISRNTFKFTHDPNINEAAAMKKLTRRINEKAHELIYIEAFAKNDESLLAEDETSNLLYRKWLERMSY